MHWTTDHYCSQLLEMTDSRWRVHSVFDHAMNLTNGNGQLIGIVVSPKVLAPYSLCLPSVLPQGVDVGQQVEYEADHRRFVFPSNESITLKAGASENLYLSPWLMTASQVLWFVEELFSVLNSNPKDGALTEESVRERLITLKIALKTGEDFDVALKDFVGFGNGLTPSGDDFLIGLSWVLNANRYKDQGTFRSTLLSMTARTTDVSANMLKSVVEGRYIEPLCQLTQHQTPLLLQKILSIGHCSGRDTLLGMYWGMKTLLDIQLTEL